MVAAMAPILIEDAFQVGLNIFQAIQAAHAKGATTIDAATWAASVEPRDAALRKLDADIATAEAGKPA